MKTITASSLAGAALLIWSASAAPAIDNRDVDTSHPYTGPDVPIGDWVDPTINGNGKGFPRLLEAPAVKPSSSNPTNNVNVISLSYLPSGINIHYQTPFGLGVAPTVRWGTEPSALTKTAKGFSHTYERQPPCSAFEAVTQCSEWFHEVQIASLAAGTTYYYQISAANGTTESEVLSFKTSLAAGDKMSFSVAVINDMGYTNAQGTHQQLLKAVDAGTSFVWHGGDLSYADDWYSGILPCESSWPVCYNGSDTLLPGPAPVPDEYKKPLPDGEVANQGGPQGGDMSVIYESNWDLWQNWMSDITTKVPYQVAVGNHEASCAEFDGPSNELTAYLNDDKSNSTAAESELTYYSCPPSQRNFTAYQHRFNMAGEQSGGVGNFWYSFDNGLAHFVTIDGETDYPDSPEWPFIRDTKGVSRIPDANETYVTDGGPFGEIDGDYLANESYEQLKWFKEDLAKVDRTITPWIIVMSHRPMYSSAYSEYQTDMQNAFEATMLEYGVDVYIAGHIHWYERMLPLGANGTIDTAAILNNNTYLANEGKSITHLTNGAAGNIESHSTLDGGSVKNITQTLDFVHYGMSLLTVVDETKLEWEYVHGIDGTIGDKLTILKNGPGCNSTATSSGSTTARVSSTSIGIGNHARTSHTTSTEATSAGVSTLAASVTATAASTEDGCTQSQIVTTKVVTDYTTWCTGATTFTQGSHTYTVSSATTLTITDCPCTITYTTTANGIAPTTATEASSSGSSSEGGLPGGAPGGNSTISTHSTPGFSSASSPKDSTVPASGVNTRSEVAGAVVVAALFAFFI